MQAFEILSVAGSDVVAAEGREFNFSVEKGVAIQVPFSLLFRSEKNVRTKQNAKSIPELAAMIKAEGLIYPLCVVAEKTDGEFTGRYGVVAGGRRLAAIALLIESGDWPAEVAIACLEFSEDRAVRVSAIENAGQEAMHPADQIVQFKTLVDEGLTAAEIAAAHGVSPLTVERRLKLANLAPSIMALFREDKIGQDQLQALALAPDHARQVEVWESLSAMHRTSAYHIRDTLTEGEVRADVPAAIFVGVEAYEAAGGAVRRDLFGTARDVFLQNRELLNSMVAEKLAAKADELRAEGWKWVEVVQSFGWSEKSRFSRVYPTKTKPEAGEAEAVEYLDAMIAALRKRMDELEGDDYDELPDAVKNEIADLEEQIESIGDLRNTCQSHFSHWAAKTLQRAGVVVTLDHDGTLAVHAGLVRPEDQPKDKQADAKNGLTAAPEKSEFSKSLVRDMTAHRTAAVAATLIANPKVALVALLHKFIIWESSPWIDSPLNVSLSRASSRIRDLASGFNDSPAAQAAGAAAARWDEQLPTEPAALYRHLMGLEMAELNALLALHVADSYNVITDNPATKTTRFEIGAAIEESVGLNMADWWAPDSARYLSQVSKAQIVEAVTEACGANEALPLEKMKKGDAVAAAEAKLQGKGWLPPVLRGRAVHEDPTE